MSTADIVKPKPGQDAPPDTWQNLPSHEELEALLPKVELVESDGTNMDSDWHRINMELLLAAIRFHLRGRDDYYASGNSIIYYSHEQARNRDFIGPDFYFVSDVPRERERRYWVVWEEGGRYPDVIVELMSPTTARKDLTKKKDLYERTFHTSDYYCYDPDAEKLLGWTHAHGRYEPLEPNTSNRLWCGELGLWLGTWRGVFHGYDDLWLRFFHEDGTVVFTGEEFALKVAESAQVEHQQAEAERQRAQAERERAEQERQRADAAAEELVRLKALLAEKGITA